MALFGDRPAFVLGTRSNSNLVGVHPDLVKVVRRAIQLTEQDFIVIEGLRTLERQKELLKKKATKTLNSRHLTGHAVDIAPWVRGTISWDWKYFPAIKEAMFEAAKELGVDVVWGGGWSGFPDGPHWELSRSKYPA